MLALKKNGDITMSSQPGQTQWSTSEGTSGSLSSLGTTRTTGNLLATQGYVVGIEISGSGARQSVALADLGGNILHSVRRPLEYVPDTKTALDLIDEMLAEALTPERLHNGRVLRVGVAVGGLVDATHGIVHTLHHAHGWNDFPLQDYLSERLDIPCIIDNNANAAALAEVQYGAASVTGHNPRNAERVVLYIGLGRGIGGGLVINGKIFHGETCTAGEIGHIFVKENGPKCSCGGYGHLEAIASSRAISRAMAGLSVEHSDSEAVIQHAAKGRFEDITAEQVFQLAAEGDKVAQSVVHDVQTYLGIALANIVQLINPGIIILGGHVAQAGDVLIRPLQARVHELCLAAAHSSLRIVQSSFGSEANIVGAVTLALQDIA
jgi:glucokinase